MTTLELETTDREQWHRLAIEELTSDMHAKLVDATGSTMVGDQAVRIGPAIRLVDEAIERAAVIAQVGGCTMSNSKRIELACNVAAGTLAAWTDRALNGQGSIEVPSVAEIAHDALEVVDVITKVANKKESSDG